MIDGQDMLHALKEKEIQLFYRKLKGKWSLGRFRLGWEDNIKTN
jgi:hypothetical protein